MSDEVMLSREERDAIDRRERLYIANVDIRVLLASHDAADARIAELEAMLAEATAALGPFASRNDGYELSDFRRASLTHAKLASRQKDHSHET